MERRAFLRWLLAAMGGAVLDPERLLWVPGEKTLFVPPVTGWSGHTVVTPDWLAREVLAMLEKNLVFARAINREYAACVGTSVTIRTPARWRK